MPGERHRDRIPHHQFARAWAAGAHYLPHRAPNRARKNRDGYDETHFLSTLDEVVARGTTSAEEMLGAYHTRWGGSIEPAFMEYAY